MSYTSKNPRFNSLTASGSVQGGTITDGTASITGGAISSVSTLSMSGDLTVDTSTLKVDSTNNRVGVGVAAPSFPLHVRNAGSSVMRIENSDGTISSNTEGYWDFIISNSDGGDSGSLFITPSESDAIWNIRNSASSRKFILDLATGKTVFNWDSPSVAADSQMIVLSTGTSLRTSLMLAGNESFAGTVQDIACDRSANSAYNLLTCVSNFNGTQDTEFNFRGDGNGFADGSFTGGGADYAEYFESTTGAALEVGKAVVIDNGKVRVFDNVTDSDSSIIGVVRPQNAACVVGNAGWNHWSEKFLKTDFGGYLLDVDGNRQLNPSYDPEAEYIPREERDEWNLIGLVGQVPVKKGETLNPRWLNMGEYSSAADMTFIR